MRRVDLHDDALLDRARQKTLSASDRERLNTHCRSCAACALELGWIEDGMHVPAPTALDQARGRAAVDAVLGAALGAAREAPRMDSMAVPKERVQPRASRTRKRRAAALAFVGLFVSSAAAAYFTGAAQYVQTQWLQHVVNVEDVMPAHSSKKSAVHAKRVLTQSAIAVADTSVPQAVPQEPNVPMIAPQMNAAPLEAARVPDESSPPSAANAEPALDASARAKQASAETLFAAANAARADGDFAIAEARYARLSQLYPGTRAELVSRVSRGNLWLSRFQSPARARDSFSSYLAARPDGTLSEEARVGLAQALAKLGRNEDERAAWAALIQRHPGSLHAAYARTRIDELSR